MKNRRGKFIVIEGLDGVGKSTQIPQLQSWLTQNNYKSIVTCEPGGGKVGDWVRETLKSDQSIDTVTALYLLLAGRSYHYTNFIKPNIDKGTYIISDRFSDSSYAYQTFNKSITPVFLDDAHKLIFKNFEPDFVFFLDLDIPKLLTRLRERTLFSSEKRDVMEQKFNSNEIEYLNHIRSSYLNRVNENPGRYFVISAAQEPKIITQEIINCLENKITENQ